MTLSIPLISRKTAPLSIGQLLYRRAPVNKMQARLSGRYMLKPEVDLNDFSCRAVIDWITVCFWLGRETQHQWLQSDVVAVLGAKAFIHAIDEKPGGVSDKFDIRIQEPELPLLRQLHQRLEAKFDLHMPPLVRAMEISVDFTPREHDDVARSKLYTVLTRHIWTGRDTISRAERRMRYFPDASGTRMEHVLAYSPRQPKSVNDHHLVSTDRDRAPFVDSTYYVGARDDDVRWRIMDKVVDRQNRSAGTSLALDDAMKRMRVEVTLDRPEVAALGIDYVDDLKGLRFSTLQGRFFKFMLPTFPDEQQNGSTRRTAIATWKSRQRMEKFRKTGVIGLEAMDKVLDQQMKRLRKRSAHHLAQRGLALKPLARRGVGVTGHLVAYAEMNERIGIALTNLGQRVVNDFSALVGVHRG